MTQPKRRYPPVIISHPQSETYDEGFERIFGSEPRGPLARKKVLEAQLPPFKDEEDWREWPKNEGQA